MSKLLRWLACGVSVVLLSFWAVESRASDGARWEIWTGSLADYTKEFNTGNYSANFLGKNSELNPSLGYFVNDHWEILLAPSIGIQGSGNYSVNFMAGGAFNFLGDSLRDHAFVKAYFGFDDMLDNRISDTIHFTLGNWAWSVAVGKRFELTPSVAFAPEISYKWIKDSYSPITFLTVVPLQFTLLF